MIKDIDECLALIQKRMDSEYELDTILAINLLDALKEAIRQRDAMIISDEKWLHGGANTTRWRDRFNDKICSLLQDEFKLE